jgi:hypothetical protein
MEVDENVLVAKILRVDLLNCLRLRQDQKIVVAAQIVMEILETFGAERGFVELQVLDHGAHGAIEHKNAFAGEIA